MFLNRYGLERWPGSDSTRQRRFSSAAAVFPGVPRRGAGCSASWTQHSTVGSGAAHRRRRSVRFARRGAQRSGASRAPRSRTVRRFANQQRGTSHVLSVAHTTEVPVEKNAPAAQGHPMTAVVVTQYNLIVAVYLTMPDGRLLRFDKSANIP